MIDIDKALRELALARRRAQITTVARQEFERRNDFLQELLRIEREAKATLDVAEDVVRQAMQRAYQHDGTKQLAGGAVAIRVAKRALVNEDAALAWCRETGNFLVESYDQKKYEVALRNGLFANQPGAIEERPTAIVETDLSRFLDAEALALLTEAQGVEVVP